LGGWVDIAYEVATGRVGGLIFRHSCHLRTIIISITITSSPLLLNRVYLYRRLALIAIAADAPLNFIPDHIIPLPGCILDSIVVHQTLMQQSK